MKELFRNGWSAFFASTIEDGDFAVPLRQPGETNGEFYRRSGWSYFFRVRSLLVKGVPRIELPTTDADGKPETRPRQFGTVHIVQAAHGDRVVSVVPALHDPEDDVHERNISGGPVYHADTDGLYTNQPMSVLMVTGADCPPVLILDPVTKAIALVHSGRKGTMLNIVGKAVRLLSEKTGTPPGVMQAVIGPGIDCHNYEVSPEIAAEFKAAGWEKALWGVQTGGAWHWVLDLKYVIAHQLQDAGLLVSTADLRSASECTYDHPETWHSFRRDTQKGYKSERPRVQAFFALLLT